MDSRGLNDSLDNRGVSHSTNRGKGMDSRGDHWGSSVWEGSKNHSRVSLSIPLDDGVGKGKSITKTMVAKTGITHSGDSRSGNNGMMDHRADRGVVDQGGGSAEDCGASSNDSRIGIPLDNGMGKGKSVAKTVVANSDRDSVGSHLMADLSGGHLNRLDDRVAGNGANRGKAEGCRSSNHWGSGVWEGCVEQPRIGLRGGRSRSNDC